jgi:hypothetical protein
MMAQARTIRQTCLGLRDNACRAVAVALLPIPENRSL